MNLSVAYFYSHFTKPVYVFLFFILLLTNVLFSIKHLTSGYSETCSSDPIEYDANKYINEHDSTQLLSRTVKPLPPPSLLCTHWIVLTSTSSSDIDPVQSLVLENWCVVVVSHDDRSATAFSVFSSPSFIVLTLEDQAKLPFTVLQHLHTSTHCGRKSIGYLYAIYHGAKVIYDTEDNKLLSHSQFSSNLTLYNDISRPTNDKEMFAYNLYPFFLPHTSSHTIYPRGFPPELVSSALAQSDILTQIHPPCNISIVQFLQQNNPDIDSMSRTTQNQKLLFQRKTNTLILSPTKTFVPLNSQATLWYASAFWGLLLPITVTDRVADIWRGYFVQTILFQKGENVAYGPPCVTNQQNRTHMLLDDLKNEADLYFKSSELLKFLKSRVKNNNDLNESIFDSFYTLLVDLYDLKYIGKTDLLLAQAWIDDLKSIGYDPTLLSDDEKTFPQPLPSTSSSKSAARSKSAAVSFSSISSKSTSVSVTPTSSKSGSSSPSISSSISLTSNPSNSGLPSPSSSISLISNPSKSSLPSESPKPSSLITTNNNEEEPLISFMVRSYYTVDHCAEINLLWMPSMELFSPKGSEIILILDTEQEIAHSWGTEWQRHWQTRLPHHRIRVEFEEKPSFYEKFPGVFMKKSKGYDQQQWSTFYFDQYTNAKYIGVMDSDSVLWNYVLPNWLIKNNGTHEKFFTWVAKNDDPYNDGTKKALGVNGRVNGMWDGFPVFIRKDTFQKTRDFVAKQNGETFDNAILRILNGTMSQFNILMNYAYIFQYDDYDWHYSGGDSNPTPAWGAHWNGNNKARSTTLPFCRTWCKGLMFKENINSPFCSFFDQTPGWPDLFTVYQGGARVGSSEEVTEKYKNDLFQFSGLFQDTVSKLSCIPPCAFYELDTLLKIKIWNIENSEGETLLVEYDDNNPCYLDLVWGKPKTNEIRKYKVSLDFATRQISIPEDDLINGRFISANGVGVDEITTFDKISFKFQFHNSRYDKLHLFGTVYDSKNRVATEREWSAQPKDREFFKSDEKHFFFAAEKETK